MFYLSQFRHDARLAVKLVTLQTVESSVLKHKLQLLRDQLSVQENSNWPCRSRSYLFEILFLLARPDEEQESFLPTQIDSRFSKLTMAAALLRDTELTVNEICERSGFSDISYFSRSFKKEIRFTPSEYRRINVS